MLGCRSTHGGIKGDSGQIAVEVLRRTVLHGSSSKLGRKAPKSNQAKPFFNLVLLQITLVVGNEPTWS